MFTTVYAVTMPLMRGDVFDLISSSDSIPKLGKGVVLRGIVRAIAHAHYKNVAHHDLKPENVFIAPDGTILLGDWGYARKYTSASARTSLIRGSPGYAAEEVYKGDYDPFKADMWSVGAVFVAILAGMPPIPPMPSTQDAATSPTMTLWKKYRSLLKDAGPTGSYTNVLNDLYCNGSPQSPLGKLNAFLRNAIDNLLLRIPDQRMDAAKLLSLIA